MIEMVRMVQIIIAFLTADFFVFEIKTKNKGVIVRAVRFVAVLTACKISEFIVGLLCKPIRVSYTGLSEFFPEEDQMMLNEGCMSIAESERVIRIGKSREYIFFMSLRLEGSPNGPLSPGFKAASNASAAWYNRISVFNKQVEWFIACHIEREPCGPPLLSSADSAAPWYDVIFCLDLPALPEGL